MDTSLDMARWKVVPRQDLSLIILAAAFESGNDYLLVCDNFSKDLGVSVADALRLRSCHEGRVP